MALKLRKHLPLLPVFFFVAACNPAAHTQTSTPSPATATIALTNHYVSSRISVQFDYPEGWTVREYQDPMINSVRWILVSNQPAFFEDPLSPAGTGAFLNVVSWADVVGLDAAVMTPDPPRFTTITPDPASVSDTMGFYSEWTNGYCLGRGCQIDLSRVENIRLGGRRAVHGNGTMYLCRQNSPTPEGLSACELDIYGVIVETADPDRYIALYVKGRELSANEPLFLEIAGTLALT